MGHFPRLGVACGLLAAFTVVPSVHAQSAGAKAVALVRKVSLLSAGSNVEVEIVSSGSIVPHTQLLASPDRLVIDLPESRPSTDLQGLNISRGEVKNVRVGLFSSSPSVTRVVLDLSRSEEYQVFPSGKTVIIKLGSSKAAGLRPGAVKLTGAKLTQANESVPRVGIPVVVSEDDMPATLPASPRARVEVIFRHGMLTIHADRGTLAEVLSEVKRLTGADIAIPAGAQQEQIVTDIGPAPARDAMAKLLNGSHFNFIIVGSDRDPNILHSVELTPKQGGGSTFADAPPAREYSSANQPPPDPVQAQQVMPLAQETSDDTPPPIPEPDDAPAPQPQ